jgi:hypothetical protein
MNAKGGHFKLHVWDIAGAQICIEVIDGVCFVNGVPVKSSQNTTAWTEVPFKSERNETGKNKEQTRYE